MSTIRLTRIVCDGCGMTSEGMDSAQAARDHAVMQGWQNQGRRDYCLYCKGGGGVSDEWQVHAGGS